MQTTVLTICSECSYEASERARDCPNCGFTLTDQPGEEFKVAAVEPTLVSLRGGRWMVGGVVAMVAGAILILIGLRWLPWFEVTDGLRAIGSSTYEVTYGDSLLAPIAFVAAAVVAGFASSDAERRIIRWAGIVVIIGGLAWMWLLLDRAAFIGGEPDLFSGVSPGLVVALLGTLVALVGTDIVTIGAWVSRRRT